MLADSTFSVFRIYFLSGLRSEYSKLAIMLRLESLRRTYSCLGTHLCIPRAHMGSRLYVRARFNINRVMHRTPYVLGKRFQNGHMVCEGGALERKALPKSAGRDLRRRGGRSRC